MSDSVEKSSDAPAQTETSGSGEQLVNISLQDRLDDESVIFKDSSLSEQIHAELQGLRLDHCLTDVVLVVQDEKFSCHRAVLAAASLYFR